MEDSLATNYKKREQLGDGAFGNVFLVEEIGTGTVWVSKEIRLSNLDVFLPGSGKTTDVHRSESTPGSAASEYHQTQRIVQNPIQQAGPNS
jgi:hypothetical protein